MSTIHPMEGGRSASRHGLIEFQRVYLAMDFQRDGLFRQLRAQTRASSVLYPGCSFHLTPALHFRHVTFVDRDPAAAAFFGRTDAVAGWIRAHRARDDAGGFRFVAADYEAGGLPLAGKSYDLLLGLFAPGIPAACADWIRPGGWLVTNNHLGDAAAARSDPRWTPEARLEFRRGRYDWSPWEAGIEPEKTPRARRYLRGTPGGARYHEAEVYWVFRRSRVQARACPPAISDSSR